MYIEMLRKTADDLVRMAGGYNLTTLAAVGLGALVVGFVLGRFFGFLISISLLLVCLLTFGAAAFVRSRRAGDSSELREDAPAAQYLDTAGATRQTTPAFEAVAPTPVPVPVEFSALEGRLMEHLARSEGDVSVSALADELSVSGDTIRETIEGLANRGVISLC